MLNNIINVNRTIRKCQKGIFFFYIISLHRIKMYFNKVSMRSCICYHFESIHYKKKNLIFNFFFFFVKKICTSVNKKNILIFMQKSRGEK